MGLTDTFQPCVVNSDNGSAFVSHHFREFLSDRQIRQTFSPPYTPQLNSYVERLWGTAFGTARVLLAASNLPPSMHPFAVQTAIWIINRLPRPSRGNQSPYMLLARTLPSLEYLYTFGCLCLAWLTEPLRRGDRHFADRGSPSLYLGPSEEGSMSVVYVFALRRVLPVAKIRVWEDVFPGLRGSSYNWFPDGVGDSGGAANAGTDGTDADTVPTDTTDVAAPDPATDHRNGPMHASTDPYSHHQKPQGQPQSTSPATVEMPGGPDFPFSPPSPATSAAAPHACLICVSNQLRMMASLPPRSNLLAHLRHAANTNNHGAYPWGTTVLHQIRPGCLTVSCLRGHRAILLHSMARRVPITADRTPTILPRLALRHWRPQLPSSL